MLTYDTNTYTYTANGELLTKTVGSQVTTYGYDAFGNLRTVALPDSTQIEYVIDGQNLWVGKKINNTLIQGFLYDGQLRIVAELDDSGAVVSRFIYSSKANVPDYMIKNGVTYLIISDHLGSLRLVIDTNINTIVQRLDYIAWPAIDRQEPFNIVIQGRKARILKKAIVLYHEYTEGEGRKACNKLAFSRFACWGLRAPIFWAIYLHAEISEMTIDCKESSERLILSFSP